MTMIIPEWWLADAKYPVVVDPVVGSSVAGAYTEYDYMTQENYDEYLEDKTKDPSTQLEWYKDIRGMEFDQDLLCNKCTTPLQLQGTYNAYVYINGIYSYRKDNKPAVYPLLYSDFNNKPKYLLVNDNTMGNPLANVIDPGSYTPHWTQATLDTNGSVAANAHVWFGFWGEYCDTRFDYGAPLFRVCLGTQIFDYREDYNSFVAMTQDFGFYDIGFDANDITDDPDSINVYPGARYDFKVSMYLAVPASYTRTVTQWVKPTESRKLTGKYQRSAKQTALGKGVANRFEGFCRSVAQTVKNTMSLKGSLALIRKLTQQAGINDTVKRLLSMLRKPTQTAGAGSGTQRITQTKRGIADTGKPGTTIGRKQDFKRGIAHGGTLQAAALRSANYAKRFQETAGSAAYTGVARTMALRLIEAVAALYATKAGGGFNRGIGDTAGNSSCMSKTAAFFRSLLDSANGEDGAGNSVGRIRVVQDTGNAEDAAGHVADYLRGLFVEAGNIVETTHRGTYYRTQQDTAVNEGVALRHLFIFLRLLTGAYIRDYIIGRFLKSKEELIIKSPVCREITLESCL
jgi:hypothetical protein